MMGGGLRVPTLDPGLKEKSGPYPNEGTRRQSKSI
jgi:hypothetical protein